MAILARLDNPVLWQEFTHQERTAPRWMRRSQLLGIGAIVLILVGVPLTLQNDNAYPTMQLALFVTWVVHAAVALRAIVAGANAISREHVGQTWDALTLTRVTDRQILLGKWRAALWRVRGWMVALGVVRLAMLPVFMIGLVKTFAWYMCGQYTYTQYSGSSPYCSNVEMSWVPWAAVLAVVMTVVLTLLDVLCCTALGLAASALTRRGSTAAMVAILVRFTPVLLFGAFTRDTAGERVS
jgi:ABC-type transport system involved in multi-copper enzyme maturation permease subunit